MRVAAAVVAGCTLCLLVVGRAYTATNTVPATSASAVSFPITADALKPPACAGISLDTIVAGTVGTAGNDLLLGTSGDDVMTGLGGNDCILGGGGNDTIDGGLGTNVCIGGPGLDVFVATCQTQIQ